MAGSQNESNLFFSEPILNSPYLHPGRHWELDQTGQPTQKIIESRRIVSFLTPIPKPNENIEAEFTEVFQMKAGFEKQVAGRFDQMVDDAIRSQSVFSKGTDGE